MPNVFWIFALVFCIEILFLNITDLGKKIRIPGDIDLEKIGIYIRFPFVSAIILTVILSYVFNFFQSF